MTELSDYLPLGKYLQKQALSGFDIVTLSFQEIERIIHRKLPPTARNNRNWWANSKTEKFRQCSAWLNYEWSKYLVDIEEEIAVFVYKNKGK
jgi:DNA repair photolyase